MNDNRPVIQIGHSPDPDDAFMWWAIATGQPGFEDTRFRYAPVARDIESLNRAAEEGDLEVTALSCAQYPRVAEHYVITSVGASIGEGHGPRIVSRARLVPGDLRGEGAVLAVPGIRTSAFAAASILLGPGSFRHAVVPFDEIIPAVAAGEFTAGLVIHEGQLTYADSGLSLVADLGTWWSSHCGLPLPLGLNVVRRDLDRLHGQGALRAVEADLRRSLERAMLNRGEALRHAATFARGLEPARMERFVDMYVNRFTVNLGSVGRAAIGAFLDELWRARLVPRPVLPAFL